MKPDKNFQFDPLRSSTRRACWRVAEIGSKHLGDIVRELERNIPGHSNWEGSFFERLSEYGEWDREAFWRLHIDLVELAKLADENPIDRNLAYMLIYLQQRVLSLVAAHFAKNDIFSITNLKGEQLYEFKERFDMAITGVITGEVLPESSFDLVNPLLINV